jgi:hypothetical protein
MSQSHPAPRETPAPIELDAARRARQRQQANDGRPDRVAELAADLEAFAQGAKWSLSVADAQRVHGLIDNLDGAGCDLSGDHRPRGLHAVG